MKSNLLSDTGIVQRKYFTAHFGNQHKLLIGEQVEKESAAPLHVSKLELHQHIALTQILMGINSFIIHLIAEEVTASAVPVAIQDVLKMPADDRGKVRYCIGWAIYKVYIQ